jgi:ribosomal protein L37AE/L43A
MMDYDDWLKEKESNSAYKPLDAIAGTVGRMYESVSPFCPNCESPDIEVFNSHLMKCNDCGHYHRAPAFTLNLAGTKKSLCLLIKKWA